MNSMTPDVASILTENDNRKKLITEKFDPLTGEGSIGKRQHIIVDDYPLQHQWLPTEMLDVPLVKKIVKRGSIANFLTNDFNSTPSPQDITKVVDQFTRVRCRYDFPFWAATFASIKNKGGGEDVPFILNRPQRKLIETFERCRRDNKPIRVILLKARQWGGSTATQIYMAWLQLIHETGLNSLIVGHVKDASTEVKDMFDRLMQSYPIRLLYPLGSSYKGNEPKVVGVGQSGNIHRIPQRNCKIKVGTAERPNSARGGDYNLVHCTEVGLWQTTEGKTPEQIVRSACSGILLRPYTMIVYESTANGTGNFFQREYDAAKRGKSQFEPLFVSWYEIEQYAVPMTEDECRDMAQRLLSLRQQENATSEREVSGRYLWWLWEKGATLEAIRWYELERSKYRDDGDMASEYPSDDVEAFVHSGARVFDKYHVERLRQATRPPRLIGELQATGDEGEPALQGLHFVADRQGALHIWSEPEIDEEEYITNRYLVVVDIGGRGSKADWSVIVIIDRLMQMDGGVPTIVAQWRGHIDMDILAWKAAQIAAYYDNALLVIEANTLETHDAERRAGIEGDMGGYILNRIRDVYSNLYARAQSDDEIREGAPRKYGFHTNVATKPMIIATLIKVIREGLYVERDEQCLNEYLTYEKKKNGAYGAISGMHDDLLMTRAIGLHIAYYEMELPSVHKRSALTYTAHRKSVGMASL